MDQAEFRRLVRHGLGRAILYLQENDPAPYVDVIMDACLHNDVYDQQQNGRRGRYLWELINLSNDQRAIRDHLIAAIDSAETDATDDWSCVPPLLRRFAERGEEEARTALYRSLHRDGTPEGLGDTIVKMDGLDGLFAIAHELGEQLGPEHEFLEGYWAMLRAYDDFGKEHVWAALEQAADSDAHIDAFLIQWRKEESTEQWVPPDGYVPPYIPFEEVQQAIESQVLAHSRETTGFAGSSYMRWGTRAQDDDLEAAALAFTGLDIEDKPRLARYLRIFQKRAFPLNVTSLLATVDHHIDSEAHDPEEYDPLRVTWWAIRALSHVSDPAVGSLALTLRERPDWWSSCWIGPLRHNFTPGDLELILESAQSVPDDEAVHRLCWDVLDLLDEYPIPELAPSLEVFYDRNPCAYCRGNVVRKLSELDALSDWIIDECRYDSDEETRKFVASIAVSK